MTWEAFRHHLDEKDAASCAKSLSDILFTSKNFGDCKTAIASAVLSSSDICQASATLAETLLLVLTDTATPIAYLILMALSDLESVGFNQDLHLAEVIPPHIRARLESLIEEALSKKIVVSARVVMKSITLFQMSHFATGLIELYANGLLESGAYISVLKCVEYFTWIKWPFPEIVEEFAETNSWPMAEQLLKLAQQTLPCDEYSRLAACLVKLATQHQELKRAHRYVHQYELQDTFPDLESLFRREALEKLCSQRKWAIASNFVGSNVALQVELCQKLIAAGEYTLANEQRERFQIQDLVPEINEDEEPRSQYLELGGQDIVWCDTDQEILGLKCYVEDIVNSTEVCWMGLDVEWKAALAKQDMAIASILQISIGTKIFLIDFIALESSSVCFGYLEDLFADKRVIKVGFGFLNDLKVLQQSFPGETNCFDIICGVIELDAALRLVFPTYTGKSLSDACAFVLGKPLEKKQQLSNWNLRPLEAHQLKYAALDAYCLIQMIEILYVKNHAILSSQQNLSLKPIIDLDIIERSKQLRHIRRTIQNSDVYNPVLDFLENHPSGAEVTVLSSSVDLSELSSHVFANSLCLLSNGNPHVAILGQGTRLDLALFAKLVGASRRKVRFATPQECVQMFGYAPGTVPPIAHLTPGTQLWIDKYLPGSSLMIFGGGPQCLLECTMPTLLKLSPEAKIAALSAEEVTQVNSLEPKFLADSMLGRVSKWLRMTGVDILHWDIVANPRKDEMLALATAENRIILTRDRKMSQQRAAFACYVVASDNVEAQFQEIKKHFGIEFDQAEFMSRCAKCNEKGFNVVDRSHVQKRDDVPQKVLDTVDEFYECRSCHQLYWVGPKYSTAQAKMKQIFQ
ncbi:hypothetical protein LEN26_015895 [Aphanomyces euteiches]|nr:hypothetical protein LEN26_015895 [Aphanomyces euteiches]